MYLRRVVQGRSQQLAARPQGPARGACKAHYFYDTAANRCVDCGNKIKASGDNIIGTVLAVLFVVAAIGVVMRKFGIFTVLGHGVDAIREVVQGEAVKDIAKAKLEEHYEDDEDGEAAGSDTQSADDKESSGRSMEQNVMTKAKIVIATYQIACSIPWSLPQYDGGYGDGVNVMRIDPTISCDSPSYDAWLPYAVLDRRLPRRRAPRLRCLLWRLRRRLDPDVDHQTVRTPSGRTIGEAGAHAANQEDEDFLHEALERHAESMVQFQKLEARANDPTLESVRFLYEEFKPSCFMFMVYEIAIGLLGSLISYRVFSHYEPYVEEDDGSSRSGDELRSCVAGLRRRVRRADDANDDGGAATVDAEAVERADVALASARI
ncbi:serine/threonine kinase [Aureococcus anophagefferens]|nr:serine/threonine kinase [Aureococcus anophagefferens]